jgi:pimeloyl-ACP methyl ester carboxylesterase
VPIFTVPDETNLYYTDEGSGTPLLLLSGLTRNSDDFQYVIPHLRQRGGLRIVTMDYRGRGKSDWADPTTYSIVQETQDALHLLDHLNISSTAILGTSRGGLNAMAFAATHKNRLKGVALNDIGPELSTSGMNAIRSYVGRNPKARTYLEAATMRAQMMVGFANVPASRWLAEVHTHYRQTPDGLKINYDPRLSETLVPSTDTPLSDLWSLFDALENLPLCVIKGENSDLFTQSTFDKVLAKRPDMMHAIVEDRGHVPFLDEPAALHTLNKWLDCL